MRFLNDSGAAKSRSEVKTCILVDCRVSYVMSRVRQAGFVTLKISIRLFWQMTFPSNTRDVLQVSICLKVFFFALL